MLPRLRSGQASVRLPAFAKINLWLEIVGRRADGYHELRTVFQTISLKDELRIELLRGRKSEMCIYPAVELSGADSGVLGGPANLVWRAIEALRRELGVRNGVRVDLVKRIPVGRGLGGGSSDAAAALVGFLRLVRKRLPAERLLEIAAGLGADVPFFLLGGRALGVGRGDEVYPLADLERQAVLVVSPRDIAVNTRQAYRWLAARLTKRRKPLKLARFCALSWSARADALSNDFEAAVFPRHPRLRVIKRALLRSGAAGAALAGSGSAVFALFPNPAKARRAARAFSSEQVFVVETVSRENYRRALSLRGWV